MTPYKPRFADSQIRKALTTFGAVVIQGPRASGKTTTGKTAAASFVALDSAPQLPVLAETAPAAILAGKAPRLIDEWQLAPTLWNAVRHETDQRGIPGQFILTGSAIPTDDVTRHSGAGRFRPIHMRPMSLAESGESTASVRLSDVFAGEPVQGYGGPDVPGYCELSVRGGWPVLVNNPRADPYDYLNSYLDEISRVDMKAADIQTDPIRMRALLRALARNVSTEISATRLASEAGLSRSEGQARDGENLSAQTVRKYLDALERVFVVEEQPAWSTHLRSKARLRNQPKWHFTDPSLAAAALAASPQKLLRDLEAFGFIFESLAIRDLRIYADQIGGSVYHYRDNSNLEVDAIVELRDGQWAAFEIKIGSQAHIETAATHLHRLRNKVTPARADQLAALVVLTGGELSYTRDDGVRVVSLGHLTA